jgi:hypothetical protein
MVPPVNEGFLAWHFLRLSWRLLQGAPFFPLLVAASASEAFFSSAICVASAFVFSLDSLGVATLVRALKNSLPNQDLTILSSQPNNTWREETYKIEY